MASKDIDKLVQTQIKIANKLGQVVPFKYNWAQKQYAQIMQDAYAKNKPVRKYILKYRRAGITSCESARDFGIAWSRDNVRIGIIAHLEDRAKEILANYKFYYESMRPELQLQLAKDSIFGIRFAKTNSQVLIATAENPIKVRGDGLHVLHGSEAAHWGYNFNTTMREVAPVIPALPGTQVVLETTGSIRGCQAHDHWVAAKAKQNEYDAHFLCWLDDPEMAISFESRLHQDQIFSEIHQLEPRLTEKNKFYKLTPEQIHQAFHYYFYQSKCDFDYFCREFPYTEDEAWSSGGASFFGNYELGKINAQAPDKIYAFDSGHINKVFTSFSELREVSKIEDYSNFPNIKIWAQPSRNGRYVIGVDCALGESYGDFAVGYVIDMGTRQMMASFHGRLRPDETAHIAVSLAKMYNQAVLAPETNAGGGGFSVLTDIQKLSYHNIYVWRTRDSNQGLRLTNKLGWWTSQRSRPIMLGELRKVFLDSVNGMLPEYGMFRDSALLNEMRSFTEDANTGIPRATRGCYDDRVMALAIAHQVAADEAYCTDKDLLYAYHKYQASPKIDQRKLVQTVKPTQMLNMMMSGKQSSGFEINDEGRIGGWQE